MTQNRDIQRLAKNGNTKHSSHKKSTQSNQIIHWFLTWNNYPENAREILETCFNKYCSKYAFQTEIGEEGTKHIQGNITCFKRMRFSEFKLPNTIHWEPTRNIDAAYDYVNKEHTHDGGFRVTKGLPKPIKLIDPDDFKAWHKELLYHILLHEPDKRTVMWYYSEKGGTGKTDFTRYLVAKHNAACCKRGQASDILNMIYNTDMDTCNIVIWDVPRDHMKISYEAIEIIKDGMINNTKYETGMKLFNPPHIVIFSNEPPMEYKLSKDRWCIINLDECNDNYYPIANVMDHFAPPSLKGGDGTKGGSPEGSPSRGESLKAYEPSDVDWQLYEEFLQESYF